MTPAPRVALATARDAWERDEDAPLLLPALLDLDLEAVPAVWDDPSVRWASFDLVVVRSTWDYTARRDEFLTWARRVEEVTRLANPSRVLEWNTDKGYLDDLADAGLPVAPTRFLRWRDATSSSVAADLHAAVGHGGDVVVKPTVSAGSNDTARYAPEHAAAATAHARRLLDERRDVMVQPYLAAVDEQGETGMVFLRGELSHAFRKGPLLLDGPARVDGLFAVEDVSARQPSPAEVDLGRSVVAECCRRCGVTDLLYARVDVLPGPHGTPVVLEAELTEPSFFLAQSPGSEQRAARAVSDWLAAH